MPGNRALIAAAQRLRDPIYSKLKLHFERLLRSDAFVRFWTLTGARFDKVSTTKLLINPCEPMTSLEQGDAKSLNPRSVLTGNHANLNRPSHSPAPSPLAQATARCKTQLRTSSFTRAYLAILASSPRNICR